MRKWLSMLLALTMLLSASAALATSTEAIAGLEANWWVDVDVPKSETFYKEMTLTGVGNHWNQWPTEFDGGYFQPTIEKMTGVRLDLDFRSGDSDYTTSVATVLAGGVDNLPHLLNAGGYGTLNLVNEGAIVALDDYLDLMPNVVAAVGEDRMAKWREADGHIYTLPALQNVPGSQTTAIRKDWLDALGMEVPDTWDEWKAYWYAVRDNDMNGNGDKFDEIPLVLEMGSDGSRCLHALLNAFGIAASSDSQFCVLDDGTYTMVYEHPNYKAFLEEVRVLYADGIIDQEFVTRYQADMYNTMSGNLAGSVFTWAEQIAVHSETLQANGMENGLYLSCAPITGPFGDSMLQMREGVVKRWTVTVKAEQDGLVEDICKFWNWMYSPEGLYLYNYGIEGYTYDMVDGAPKMRESVVAAGFSEYRTIGCQFEPIGGNQLTDSFMQCLFSGKTVADLTVTRQSFYDGLNDQGVNVGKYYSMPDTIQTEAYLEYAGELISGGGGICNLRDQCIAGQLTIDEFFERYEALKARGLQDVIDEGTQAYAEITK